jgi:hypothetical protein
MGLYQPSGGRLDVGVSGGRRREGCSHILGRGEPDLDVRPFPYSNQGIHWINFSAEKFEESDSRRPSRVGRLDIPPSFDFGCAALASFCFVSTYGPVRSGFQSVLEFWRFKKLRYISAVGVGLRFGRPDFRFVALPDTENW